MKEIIEYSLEDGRSIFIEVETNETSRQLSARKTIKKANETFDKVISTITPTAEAVINKMRNLSDSPDEISIEFGVKLSGKLNCGIISSDSEANFKVNLKWKNSK